MNIHHTCNMNTLHVLVYVVNRLQHSDIRSDSKRHKGTLNTYMVHILNTVLYIHIDNKNNNIFPMPISWFTA